MTLRKRIPGANLLMILLSLAGAFLIDQSVAAPNLFVWGLFAVPVLIAAYRLHSRGAIVIAILVFGVAMYSAQRDEVPAVPTLLDLLGLGVTSVLAILLGYERRVSARLARDAQNLLEEAQSARNTLRTIIDTLPAGVLVSDAYGTITLANATATAILGGPVNGNASRAAGRNVFVSREGTPFSVQDLPQVIERGEPSANVELRVRREDGTERVVLSGATPIRNEQGRITGAVLVFQDITERIETEEALRASQESLARAQEVAHLGNWDRDLRTGHLHWSDEVYRIFGIAPQAFTGTVESFFQHVHPDDLEQVTRAIQVSLVEGHPYGIDHRIVRPDGTIRAVHEEARVLHDAEGQAIRVVGTVQDITERKQAEEERERLLQQVQIERAHVEAIVNSTASAIIYVDATSGHVQVNPAAIQLFGHPFVPEQGQAQYVSQLLHPDGQPITLSELPSRQALQGRTTVQEELVIVRPNGEHVPVLESAAAVRSPNGGAVGAVVVLQNISTLKEIERLREEWTSIIAHDLRQPTSIIMGYAGLLEMEASDSAVQHHEIAHISASARNLSKMIDDLLDISRIEAKHLALQRQPVDLPSLVAMAGERIATVGAPSGTRHPVQLDIVGSVPPVLADSTRIEQVLGNLLTNALKYSAPDSGITLSVRQSDDTALVSVTNPGPGIPPNEVTQIFSRFYRTPKARKGREGGLGLGLYIAKGIVEAHQGQIWVESIAGQTTTFSFTLPLASPEGKPGTSRPDRSAHVE